MEYESEAAASAAVLKMDQLELNGQTVRIVLYFCVWIFNLSVLSAFRVNIRSSASWRESRRFAEDRKPRECKTKHRNRRRKEAEIIFHSILRAEEAHNLSNCDSEVTSVGVS